MSKNDMVTVRLHVDLSRVPAGARTPQGDIPVSKNDVVTVRLLFVDEGSYHHEEISIPEASLDAYDRLIDCVREDDAVLKRVYVDVDRLCSATRVD